MAGLARFAQFFTTEDPLPYNCFTAFAMTEIAVVASTQCEATQGRVAVCVNVNGNALNPVAGLARFAQFFTTEDPLPYNCFTAFAMTEEDRYLQITYTRQSLKSAFTPRENNTWACIGSFTVKTANVKLFSRHC